MSGRSVIAREGTGALGATAAAKASLARAYETTVPPKRIGLSPDGMEEMWVVGDVLMMIPVVPHDCAPLLEFALRLRREAMLSGKCEKCGAVPELQLAMLTTDPPLSRLVFNHKVTCPGRDAAVRPLLEKYRISKATQTDEDRFKGAQKATRSVIAPLKDTASALEIRGPSGEDLANELLDRLLTNGARCGHLGADPYQTWNTFIAVGDWRCNECFLYFAQNLPGSLTPMEEHTCDLCRRFAPTTLSPLVMRIDFFVMRGAACSRCFDTYGRSASEGEEQ
jgi:hypothetical protein